MCRASTSSEQSYRMSICERQMGKKRSRVDPGQQARPTFGLEIGQEIGDHLPHRHFDLRCRAVVRLEVRHDPRRVEPFAAHPPRCRAVRQRDDPVVRIGRVVKNTGRPQILASRIPAGITTKSDSQNAR